MADVVNYKDCRLEIRDDTHINYSDDYQNSAIGEVEKDDLVRGTVDRFVYWIEKYGDPIENRCNGEDLQILGLHLSARRRERGQAPLHAHSQGLALAEDRACAVRTFGGAHEGQLPPGPNPHAAMAMQIAEQSIADGIESGSE